MDIGGLIQHLIKSGHVKLGEYIPDATYREILYKATHDADFRSKPPPPEVKEAFRQIEPLSKG